MSTRSNAQPFQNAKDLDSPETAAPPMMECTSPAAPVASAETTLLAPACQSFAALMLPELYSLAARICVERKVPVAALTPTVAGFTNATRKRENVSRGNVMCGWKPNATSRVQRGAHLLGIKIVEYSFLPHAMQQAGSSQAANEIDSDYVMFWMCCSES